MFVRRENQRGLIYHFEKRVARSLGKTQEQARSFFSVQMLVDTIYRSMRRTYNSPLKAKDIFEKLRNADI